MSDQTCEALIAADRLAEAVLTWQSGHQVEARAHEYRQARGLNHPSKEHPMTSDPTRDRVHDGPSCQGCGLPNYEGLCPHCRGDQSEYERELVPPFPTSLPEAPHE